MRDYLNKVLGTTHPFDVYAARRPAQEGARDVGDVHVVPFVLECKNTARPAIPAWLRQAEVEAAHAGFPFGVVVQKVRGSSAAAGRVHVSVRTWTQIRQGLGMPTDDFAGVYGWTPTVRGLVTDRWYLTTTLDAFAGLVTDYRSTMGVGRALR
ncbi:hypothetical protein AB0901_31000 [Streptomyces roseifaciens]